MKVMLSQVNPTVADVAGNKHIIINEITAAANDECDILLLPEMVTVGYPPRDYLYQQWIWDQNTRLAQEILTFVRGLKRQITIVYGGLHEATGAYGRKERYNAAFIVDPHYGIRIYHKHLLPEYDIFNEARYFKTAVEPFRPIPIAMHGRNKKRLYFQTVDVLICEDIWNNNFAGDTRLMPSAYDVDPIEELKGAGPLLVINGSPYWSGKVNTTRQLISDICRRIRRPVCWVNQVGAHDDIITGGYSMVAMLDGDTPIIRMAKAFATDRMVVRFNDEETYHSYLGENPEYCKPLFFGKVIDPKDFDTWCDYQALVLFIKDYMWRCGFQKAVLGLSGGIDSALVATLAADAIGGENVICVSLPSKYSSEGSKTDAEALAAKLNADYRTVTIGDLHELVRAKFLSGGQQNFAHGVTDENIQPRLRSLLLMAISNDEQALLLTTGNKSEMSVGYCTLYGDMCGGIAPIADTWKTDVFAMCRFINKYRGEIIPESTIVKPPSAELRPGQQDTDSLPAYEELDPILKMMVERDMSPAEIVDEIRSFKTPPAWLLRIYKLYKNSEFKRQQGAVVAKIRQRSFGSGRFIPIACIETRL